MRTRGWNTGALAPAVALALGLTTALASPVLAEDRDVLPSKSDVRDARDQVASTAEAVGQLKAQLEMARQQLSAVMIEAAEAAEAYNGARYRLQQAREVARSAQKRADAAAAEVETQRRRLEVFAVGSATDATEMSQLGTVLSAGGPEELLAEYGAWSNTTSALQVDLDSWDATRTVADLLQAEADAAFERQQAASDEARAARAAAEQAVRTATAQ
ncbi:MAG: hypothetical protein H0W95_04285, partial [Nocardioidaceae bacterium]|nr:hypothetical protein [Nocardioidaceae bacterium]